MKPRVVKPEKGNKYYINTNDGGVNPAKGNPFKQNPDLTSLPNCVAIYGWFNECGQRGMQYLKKAYYPYSVIAQAKKEGLEVTKEPTLGGIMVWTGGKTGEGHVAGVGQIYDDKHVMTVESEYYGADWRTYKRYIGNGNWADGCYWMTALYHYEGCIKNPFVKEEEDMTKAETEALIKQMVPEILAEIQKETAQKPADAWAEDAIEYCKQKGLMVGDADGNFRPQSFVKREELASVLRGIDE